MQRYCDFAWRCDNYVKRLKSSLDVTASQLIEGPISSPSRDLSLHAGVLQLLHARVSSKRASQLSFHVTLPCLLAGQFCGLFGYAFSQRYLKKDTAAVIHRRQATNGPLW